MQKKYLLITAALLLVFIPIWLLRIVPELIKIPTDFHYQAEIFSVDNFYDAEGERYTGEEISVTQFSYDTVPDGDFLTVKNIFDVRTPAGDPIFSVERQYGIDPKTGKHVRGYGDKNREGYLFAPRMKGFLKHTRDKQPFTYWHINYDGPAHMTFSEEEEILGLVVYRYESNYEGIDIDQTDNLTFLEGVGTTRGITLDPHLQLWIEPTTGRMIKYEDRTTAYYYDLVTKARIHPWNQFGNRYTQSSIAGQVRLAKSEIQKQNLYSIYLPIGLASLLLLSLVASFKKTKSSDPPDNANPHI